MHDVLDRLGDAAMHAWSLTALAVLSTANLIAGVGTWVFAAEVSDGALVAAGLFVMGTATAIAGWALVLLVKLSGIVAKLEATADDHERRIARIET